MLDIRTEMASKIINCYKKGIEKTLLTYAGLNVKGNKCYSFPMHTYNKLGLEQSSSLFLDYVIEDNERIKSNLCSVFKDVFEQYLSDGVFSINSDTDLFSFLSDFDTLSFTKGASLLTDILSFKGVYSMWYGADYSANLSERISNIYNGDYLKAPVGFEELGITIPNMDFLSHYEDYQIHSINDLIRALDIFAKPGYICDIKLPDGAAEKLLFHGVVSENSNVYAYLKSIV